MKQYFKYTIFFAVVLLQISVLTGCGGGGSNPSSAGTNNTTNVPSNDDPSNNPSNNPSESPSDNPSESNLNNHYAYITNYNTSSVTKCLVGESDGSIANCIKTGTSVSKPYGMAIGKNGKYAYVINVVNNATDGSQIAVCSIESSDGSLTNCNSKNESGIYQPYGLAIDQSGNKLYVTNYNNNTVSVCSIDQDNGSISDCVTAGEGFKSPYGIALSSDGNYAYIANNSGASVSQCAISKGGVFSACIDSHNSKFPNPVGLAIDKNSQFMYTINGGNNNLPAITCILSTDDGSVEYCGSNNKADFSEAAGVALDSTGKYIYITNNNINSVSVCSVEDGLIFDCNSYKDNNFNGPQAIVIN